MASSPRRQAGSSSSSISRSSISSSSSQWAMKLMVDNNSQRVVFAEAGKDVVDFLFSLLTLPIGQVVKLLRDSNIPMVGCVGDLYRSVEKLDDTYMCHRDAKDDLLRPTGGHQSANVLLLTDGSSSSSSNGRSWTNRSGYVQGGVTYMIMDNLKVTTTSVISGITTLLNTSCIRDISLREKTVHLGHNEGLQILKASLESKRF